LLIERKNVICQKRKFVLTRKQKKFIIYITEQNIQMLITLSMNYVLSQLVMIKP